MEAVGEYLRTVCCGALLCAVLLQLAGKDGTAPVPLRMLCGLFLALLAISPLKNVDFTTAEQEFSDFSLEARAVSTDGKAQAEQAIRDGISRQCEAYILDKAGALGMKLSARVEVSEETHLPVSAVLTGEASPEEKAGLEAWIARELGIERSRQQWKH